MIIVAFGIFLSVAVSTNAAAQEAWLSGTVEIANDYPFRGISQTLEKPVVQGGLEIAGPYGAYAGLWGSSVNFGEDLADGDRAQLELDPYAGVVVPVAGFDLDLGVVYYTYPGAAAAFEYNFVEFGLGLSRELEWGGAGLTAAFSPNFFGSSGRGLYLGADAAVGIPSTPLSLDASLGRQTIERNEVFGTPDYTTWRLGVSADFLGAVFGVGYVGTDVSRADCFGGDDLCRGRVVVSVGRDL